MIWLWEGRYQEILVQRYDVQVFYKIRVLCRWHCESICRIRRWPTSGAGWLRGLATRVEGGDVLGIMSRT